MNELSLFSNFCNCKAKKKGENLTPPPKKKPIQNKTKHKKTSTKTNKKKQTKKSIENMNNVSKT